MKNLLMFTLILGLLVPVGMAQVNEKGSATINPFQSATSGGSDSRDLGDLNWYLDTEGITGDIRMLGVCYEGTRFTNLIWCTGAFDFTIAYIYEIDLLSGLVVNTYPQPAANWGGWGWRDLSWDGTYLYAGDPNGPYIVQIDPTNGQPTGVQYGPFPITPCRALAYDPVSDCFWTASFSSSIYQCFRDNSFNTFSGQGLSHYGAGMEEMNNMVWWWSQDGATGTLASEYDPRTQTLTGKSFTATTALGGGIAGGAGGRDLGYGKWELIGMFQGSPDHVGAFDLATQNPLVADTTSIPEGTGGTVNFSLDGGIPKANRNYLLLAGASGTVPGTSLPGGLVTLPLNWDFLTTMTINLINTPVFSNFMGSLDINGKASAKFDTLGPIPGAAGLNLYFAFAVHNPWNFASNAVTISIVP